MLRQKMFPRMCGCAKAKTRIARAQPKCPSEDMMQNLDLGHTKLQECRQSPQKKVRFLA